MVYTKIFQSKDIALPIYLYREGTIVPLKM